VLYKTRMRDFEKSLIPLNAAKLRIKYISHKFSDIKMLLLVSESLLFVFV
jgi:hypothetical protein